jgi:Putative DNA-binding domain
MAPNFWRPVAKLQYTDVEALKEAGAREKRLLDYKAFSPKVLPMPPEHLAPILAAFANSGGGRLVFGAVEKDERIVRFDGAPAAQKHAITSTIRNAAHSVQPPVDFESVDVPIPGTDTVLFVVEVRSGQRGPFQHDGRYVQRIGDGVKAMPHTSVVYAVQAAQPVRFDGEVRLDRPVLQGDGSDKWRCGVLLSPTYDDRRALYDPLGAETKEIQELLERRHYKVARQTRQLKARHGNGWDLEFWQLGHVKVSGPLDTTRPTQLLGDLVFAWERFIGDAAACLNLIRPMLVVDIELSVWSFDRTSLAIQWQEGLTHVSKHMAKNPPPRVDPLHTVADLVEEGSDGDRYDNTRPIAETAGEYLKLFIAEQDETFP